MDEPLINGVQSNDSRNNGWHVSDLNGRHCALCQEVGCLFHDELCITTCCTALAVLWMALHKEKFPLLATSLQAAAGVTGNQRWALILPSSARVSLVTHTAVIAVRYPELDNVQNGTREALSGEAAFCGVLRSCFWDRCSISV